MLAIKHLSIGIVFITILYFTIVTAIYDMEYAIIHFIIYLPFIIVYLLLPDIDHPFSLIRRIITMVFIFIIFGLLIIFYFYRNDIYLILSIIFSLFLIVTYFMSHRGIVHSVVGALIFSSFTLISYNYITQTFFINYVLFVICFVSFLTHLLLDDDISIL